MIEVIVTNANSPCEVVINWKDYTHSRGLTDSSGRIRFDVSPKNRGTISVDGNVVEEDVWFGNGTVKVRK
jgi:hypothetical protein